MRGKAKIPKMEKIKTQIFNMENIKNKNRIKMFTIFQKNCQNQHELYIFLLQSHAY